MFATKMTINTIDMTPARRKPELTYKQALLMAQAASPGGFQTFAPANWPEFGELKAMGLVEEIKLGPGVVAFVAV